MTTKTGKKGREVVDNNNVVDIRVFKTRSIPKVEPIETTKNMVVAELVSACHELLEDRYLTSLADDEDIDFIRDKVIYHLGFSNKEFPIIIHDCDPDLEIGDLTDAIGESLAPLYKPMRGANGIQTTQKFSGWDERREWANKILQAIDEKLKPQKEG